MGDTSRKIIANVDRLNHYMDKDGYSVLVLRSGKNFTYLAGVSYPGTLGRHVDFSDTPREVLLVWPRYGEPVIILPRGNLPVTQRDSWIEELKVYEAYSESPYSKLADVLRTKGLDSVTIGFEKSYLSAARWEEINRLLPKVKMIDCTQMMTEVRWIKTLAEVQILKEAADILDEAYLEVFPTVREGDTEREVHSRMVKSLIQRSAQWVHGMLNSSRNTVSYGGEGDMAFCQGDILRNDYVSYYKGYPGHQSRIAILGEPSSEQKTTYQRVLDAYRRTIDRCRVGVKASAIYQFAYDQFRAYGFTGSLGLVGHGVGPWFHQQEPIIVGNNHQEIEEGMVLAIEPHPVNWHLQDLVLVTRDGPKIISDRFSTNEMFVIG